MKDIPSPYSSGSPEFDKDLDAIRKKYGLDQFLIVYARKTDADHSNFYAQSIRVSEGMVDYINEIILPHLEEILEEDEH